VVHWTLLYQTVDTLATRPPQPGQTLLQDGLHQQDLLALPPTNPTRCRGAHPRTQRIWYALIRHTPPDVIHNNSSLTTHSQHLLPPIPIHPLRTNNSPQLPPTKRLPHAPRPDLPHRRPRLPPYFEMERQKNGSMRGRSDGAPMGRGLDCGRSAGYRADVYWQGLCGGAGGCCAWGFRVVSFWI
jgi:hypothetical protein